MFKKISAVAIIAAVAFFAVPAAANAAGYVPDSAGGNASVQATPGAPAAVSFGAGAFNGGTTEGESVIVRVEGTPEATVAVVKVANFGTFKAKADGSLSFTVTIPKSAPANAVYNITATGVTSGTVGTHTLTTVTADSGKALAFTGGTVPVMIIWGGAGILLLGIALLVVFGFVRRQRLAA